MTEEILKSFGSKERLPVLLVLEIEAHSSWVCVVLEIDIDVIF